ncbi:MAG: SHOCT domain-containing protein [Planctomycetota bacterium]|jgi:hypothetical protein
MSFKMCYKTIKYILLLVILSGTIGCANLDLNSFIKKGQSQGRSIDIFSEGKTFIRLEELKSEKGKSRTHLDHPQYFDRDILSSALSSVFYSEKGIKWKKAKNVFQESELSYLTSHIADAFTMASTLQYVLVHSNYMEGKGFFKKELFTIFALFISDNKLNVVFSRIQYENLEGKAPKEVILDEPDEIFVDPFSVTKDPFWKIILQDGQEMKVGHSNWVVIDLNKETFVKKEDYGKKKTSSVAQALGAGGAAPNKTIVIQPRMSIKDQLLELKELEATGLITKEDYELRKALILGRKQEKSIKEKFNDLRKLKEDGFISDIDYDQKKRDLLDEHEDDESKRNIKEILAEYLELRDEGFITDEDYDYKKKKLLKEF